VAERVFGGVALYRLFETYSARPPRHPSCDATLVTQGIEPPQGWFSETIRVMMGFTTLTLQTGSGIFPTKSAFNELTETDCDLNLDPNDLFVMRSVKHIKTISWSKLKVKLK